MKKIFLFGLFIFSISQLIAQEFIKESNCIKHDTSIIREYKNGEWLVCQGYKKTNHWRFMLVSETGTSGQVLTLFDHEMEITDMEIKGDMVYFCGGKETNNTSRALLGYFDMNGFPSSTVYMCLLDDVSSFGKMEVVITKSEQTHVALTGIKHDGSYCMIDAMENTTNQFDFTIADNLGDIKWRDDVAKTDHYVVYSARDENSAGLLLFNSILPSGFLTTSFVKESIGTYVSSKILLEHCNVDTLVYVTHPTPNHFLVSFHDGLTWIYSSINNIPQNDYSILDVKYDSSNGYSCVLFYEHTANNTVIIDVARTTVLNKDYGRRYIDQPLFSLEYLKNQPGRCMASGQKPKRGPLRLYRYITGQYEGCAEPFRTDKIIHQLYPIPKNMEIIPRMKQIEATVLSSSIWEENISTICETK